MPRVIGARVGVKETVTGSPAGGARGSGSSRGCAGGRRRRRTALIEPMTSLPSRCGLSALPAPEVPEAATTTASGSASPAAYAGNERQGDGGRDSSRGRRCAWCPRSASRWPGQLGQAVGPGAGVRASRRTSPSRPGRCSRKSAPQSTTRTSVAELLGDGGGLPVRQREEDDVVPGERLGGGLGAAPGRPAGAGAAGSAPSAVPALEFAGQRADLDLGVGQQQAQQLAARVTARACDGRSHPSPSSLHVYAYVLMNLLERLCIAEDCHASLERGRPPATLAPRRVKASQIGFFSIYGSELEITSHAPALLYVPTGRYRDVSGPSAPGSIKHDCHP